MKKISKEDLKHILEQHRIWLHDKGSIADLTGADLTGADLSRANLSRANLNKTNLNKTNFWGHINE